MKNIFALTILMAVASAFAGDEQYEENWRIAADGLQRELEQICDRLLPAVGMTLDDVLKKYGKPKEMYLQNSFKIRTLEFNFDVLGKEHGLATVLPATMKVTFLEDRVAESYFSMPNIDNRSSRISRTGVIHESNTEQTRFNILYRAVDYMKRVEAYMQVTLGLKDERGKSPTNRSSELPPAGPVGSRSP